MTESRWKPRGPDLLTQLESLSWDELLKAKTETLQCLDEIRGEIDLAGRKKRDGVPVDPGWLKRVHAARKLAGLRLQAVDVQISRMKLKRAELTLDRRPHTKTKWDFIGHFFMRAARDLLPREKFENIMELAREDRRAHRQNSARHGDGEGDGNSGGEE